MPTFTTLDREKTRQTLQHGFDFAQAQVRALLATYPADYYPMYTVKGKFGEDVKRWTHWCDGFYPGMMFVFAELPLHGVHGVVVGGVRREQGAHLRLREVESVLEGLPGRFPVERRERRHRVFLRRPRAAARGASVRGCGRARRRRSGRRRRRYGILSARRAGTGREQ